LGDHANPWVVLQTVSRDQIERVLADPIFRKDVDGLVEASRKAAKAPAWFQKNHADAPLTCAAYFSMEYVERSPPSGGLGSVAGDQLKLPAIWACQWLRACSIGAGETVVMQSRRPSPRRFTCR
jgi:hypothetical protein